jgi:glycosyltransferase involved in cell wall biosynthesis
VVVLPYEPTLEGSSAALRTVLASGRPTVVTPIDIFGEAGAAVHVAGGTDAASLRDAICEVLDDPELRGRLAASQAAWVEGRQWGRVARRTFGMLEALLVNGDDAPRW